MAIISTSVPTDGNYHVRFLPTIAGNAGPTLAEWNAGIDLTTYFTADGWTPGGSQATVTDDRLTAPQSFEQPGKATDTLDVIYVTNPTSASDDVAALTLVQNATGFIVDRVGIPHDTAAAATTQKVTVRPIKAGVQWDVPPEANGIFKISQKLFITNTVRRRVPLLAS